MSKTKLSNKYYIVTRDGYPLVLGATNDDTKQEILWSGDKVTLFEDRGSARNAVRRSVRYAAKFNYSWGNPKLYSIIPTQVVSA